MLKKAGIIVAASAAGILAFSPLAFAGSMGDNGSSGKDDKSNSKTVKKDDDGDKDKSKDKDKDKDKDVKKDNLENECEFSNEGGSPTADAIGGSSLLGAVAAVTSLATDATSQLNTLNCNNVNVTDVVDLDSNNEDSTTTRTSVDDSFNTEG